MVTARLASVSKTRRDDRVHQAANKATIEKYDKDNCRFAPYGEQRQ